MSKLTNLKKGVVGVCAATMLTGLCAVPAFADGGAVDVSGDSSQTSSTPVTIDAKDLQVSVTLPTAVPVALSGDTVTVPQNLQIDAAGKASIKVTSIKAVNGMTDLSFAAAGGAGMAANSMFFSVQGNALTTDAVTPATGKEIPIGSPIALVADFGTLNGKVLSSMMDGTTVAPAKLFDLEWTVALDTGAVI